MHPVHCIKYRSFLETQSFPRFSGELPKIMWKLCLSTKFPHQETSPCNLQEENKVDLLSIKICGILYI